MNFQERNRTDSLALWFEARGNPLAGENAGLEYFLQALEEHAGDWMPEIAGSKRMRRYSQAAVLKGLKESYKIYNSGRAVWLRRASPDVELTLEILGRLVPRQFWVHGNIWPLSLHEEPTRAAEWSRRLVDLFREWSSRYPVTHAYAHGAADVELSQHWEGRPGEDPAEAPHEWLRAIFWLNVFGKEWVDGLGRARVLSTPAHLVEELPNGAVLLVTRPTVADWASEEARRAQARALVHLRPKLAFDAVLRELLERSAALTPVEPRFDPDSAPFLQRVVDRFSAAERPRKIAELNALRPPEVDEWLPVSAAPPSDVPDPEAALAHYRGLADDLTIILHPDVPPVFRATPEALTEIDYRLWWETYPDFYEREKVGRRVLPAVGAYLGEMLVKHLGGRWVPRRNLEETHVVVRERAWLPFVRARRYMQSTQSLLAYSLTRFYRAAEQHKYF